MPRKYPIGSACLTPGCQKLPVICKGFCQDCYRVDYNDRKARGEDTTWSKGDVCKTEGCGQPAFCRHMCKTCYALDNRSKQDPVKRLEAKRENTEARKEEIKEHRRQYRQDKKEEIRAYNKKYAEENPELIKLWGKNYREGTAEKNNERARQWAEDNPIGIKAQRLLKNYTMSLEEWVNMWEKQDGKCAICKVELTPKGQGGTCVAVDHCHRTGAIRSLLCQQHNKGLGHFNDDPELLRATADYIEYHNKLNGVDPKDKDYIDIKYKFRITKE
jgi:hypothetical protein